MRKKAVVWGAGGYAGGELLRLLATHPLFELAGALSDTNAGQKVGQVYPGLAPWTKASFVAAKDWSWRDLKNGSWVLFSAQPHVETMRRLPPVLKELAGSDVKVVDLSGDFRLADADVYREYYEADHAAPEYLGEFVYGLTEANREAIAAASRVANPGCFATAAQLAILPLARAKVRFIAIDSKTGSSGGGAIPKETSHHPNRMNNFRAYKQLRHRHFPEIVAGWIRARGDFDTRISFVPQMAPMVRGIFTTAHCFLDKPASDTEVQGWYESYYEHAPFVRLVEGSPCVADVWGTNRCDIAVTVKDNVVVVCAAIDNLVKGAAGQAVENANLMCGFEETTGLLTPVPSPV